MSTEFRKDFLVEEDDEEEEEDEEPPTKEDCCNSGCTPCVFDIYQKRMEEKKKRRKKEEDQCRHDLISQTTFKPFIVLGKSDFGECYCRLTFQPVVRKSDLVQVKQKDFENIESEGLGERDSIVEIGRNEYKNIDLEQNERTGSLVGKGQRDSKNIHLKSSSVTDLIVEQNDSKSVTLGEKKRTDSTGEMERRKRSINLEENLGTNLLDKIKQNDSKNIDSEDSSRKNLILKIQQNNYENVTTEDEKERDLGINSLVGIEQSDAKNINLEENLRTDLEVEIQQNDSENVTAEDEKERDFNRMVIDVNVDLKIMSKGEANVEIDLDDPKDSKDMDFEREDNCTNNQLLGVENAKIIKEKQIIDNLLGEENFEIFKEQKIDGYLPYKPGQHLTMKSWRMEKSEDEQNIEDTPQYAREASMGTKTATHIRQNQNSDKYLMSEEEFVGSEKSDSITRAEATNFVNKNEDFTSYSKEEIMESEEYNLNATTETPYLIIRNKNLPPYSTSKEKIMGTKKPNFITRDYTPITLAESSSNCCFQIIIKYYGDGEMSKYLKSLKPGDITYFRGPYGDFQYLKNHKHILAICMGTGLAPIYPIFKSILKDETDETFLKLLYGSKDPQSIILRDELRDMAKFWNFGAEMFLTEGQLEGEKFGENFRAGRIGEKCVYENLKPKQLVLVCGSEIFTQEIVRYLSEFDRWKVEYFVF